MSAEKKVTKPLEMHYAFLQISISSYICE